MSHEPIKEDQLKMDYYGNPITRVKKGFISPQGIKNLDRYSYSGSDLSFCYNLFLSKFYDWLVLQVPLWVAPNLLTTIGLFWNILGFITYSYYSPNFSEDSPWWVYFFGAWCIFTYQSLDNIDGRQARRTRASSPLGELFDHVCDAAGCVIFTNCMASCTRTTRYGAWLGQMALGLPFYFSHWHEYYSVTLVLGKWDGPTEGQVMCIIVMTFTGFAHILGFNNFWSASLFSIAGYPFTAGTIIAIIFTVTTIKSCSNHVEEVYKILNAKSPAKKGKFLLWAFLQTSGILSVYALGTFYVIYEGDAGYKESPRLFTAAAGFTFAYLTSRMIIQRVCKEPMQIFYWGTIPAYVFYAHSVFGLQNWVSSRNMNWGYLFSSFVVFAYLCWSVIDQLTTHLKIRTFRIPYPPPPAPATKTN